MTPRYEWTPASEPPTHEKRVLIWLLEYGEEFFKIGAFTLGSWCERGTVLYWRDIDPPNSSATLTGSSERKGE